MRVGKESPLNADHQPTVFRAKWVCPIDQPPIENGAVGVQQGKITSVNRYDSRDNEGRKIVDLGDGVIIPGLVNAHTHLEFSDLTHPLGHAGMKFTDWIRLIVASRSESNLQRSKSDAIQSGLDETFRSGTWLIGEIATAPFFMDAYQNGNQQSLLLFLEQLGSDESRFPENHEQLTQFIEQNNGHLPNSRYRLGASPHAPYSVHPRLLRQICSIAESSSKPVAMHIAETRDELELVERQSGSFVQLLKDFGAWNPNPSEMHQSIMQILKQVATSPRSLVIHGNYLGPPELEFISRHRSRMSVVYCPRTHHYFGHESYPLINMLERRINVALGTDSRASNPDLNLFRELEFVAAAYRNLEPERILGLGTINGAKALGWDKHYGSLSIGKNAAMNLVNIDDRKTSSLIESILSGNSTCRPIELPDS